MKKFLAMLLALVMTLSLTMAFAEEEATTEVAEMEKLSEVGTIVYGSTTEISGDFAPLAWWTNNATDLLIRDLSDDCKTVVSDPGGEYVINPTVCESIEGVVNEDGSKTFTIKIKEGLVYNNGEPIDATDFAWPQAFACSNVATGLGCTVAGYLKVAGGQAFYDGDTQVLSGLRLLDDYTIQLTINSDYIPYFYDITYAQLQAFDIEYWLGEGVGIADDGEGVYFTGNFDVDNVKARIDYARFNAGEDRVSSGPYNLVEFDRGSLQATLVLNENYVGNYEGQKPSIEKIIVVKAEDATWADALRTGAFNFYDSITDGAQVNTAMDIMENEEVAAALGHGFDYVAFDRAGYGKIQFQCDFGPTQFQAVRQAIAMLLDRNEFANTFCAGWGGVVNGPYGTGMWMYQEGEEWLNENLNTYPYDPEGAVALLVEDGWVYNADGTDYTEGIRYKKVTEEEAGQYVHNVTLDDGTVLMPLIIEWSSSEGNTVSDLLNVMLAQNPDLAAAGMQINQNVMTFTELLNYMYRDSSQGSQYGVPLYGMYNLATNWTPTYDQSYYFTSDPQLVAQGYNTNYLFDDELDQLTMDMVYGIDSDDHEGYLDVWCQFVARWNELLPEIPLYSNVYVTVYPDWLEGYDQASYWDFSQSILYCTVAE